MNAIQLGANQNKRRQVRNVRRLIATTAMLAALVLPAKAVYIEGSIVLRPLATIDGVGNSQTITFTPPAGSQAFPPAWQTDDFVTFGPDSTFSMGLYGVPVPWQNFSSATGSNGVDNWAYSVTGLSTSIHTVDQFTLIGWGTLTMTGFDPTLTHFWLEWDRFVTDVNFPPPPQVAQFVLSASGLAPPAHAPGPIVGAGIPGLVMAVLGMIGWQRRRKAKLAA